MAQASEAVYIGVWTNWAYGSIRGATITLTARDGSFLVAFLALFVRVVGVHFWALLCYLVFKLRSSERGDAVHFQHQLVLRNTTSDALALRYFAKIAWAWHRRGKAHRPLQRTILYATLAFVNLAAFATAGILSSWVTKTTSEVLAGPGLCGDFEFFGIYGYTKNVTPLTNAEYSNAAIFDNVFLKTLALQGASYTKSCYGGSPQGSSCPSITRSHINGNITFSKDCPFGDLCIGNGTMVMDSGPLDSLLDFGINSSPKDSVTVQHIAECSPITTEGFRSEWLSPSDPLIQSLNLSRTPSEDDQLLLFNYGPSMAIPALVDGNNASLETVANEPIQDPMTVNFTYLFSSSAINNPNFTILSNPEKTVWILDTEEYFLNFPSLPVTTFQPISQLLPPDSDVSLFFLASGAQFTSPVNDPWFYAQKPLQQGKSTEYPDATLYVAEFPVSVVACAERSQICSKSTGQCNKMQGEIFSGFSDFDFLTDRQLKILWRLAVESLPSIASALGSEWLSAYANCQGAICAPVPDDQWQVEFQNLFRTKFATMQIESAAYVLGPPGSSFDSYWVSAAEEDSWMCHNQIIMRDDYASFSVLGIALILSIGGLIILLDLSFDRLLQFARHDRGPASDEWRATSMFQLQRLAFEGRNQGSWIREKDLIPVTEEIDILDNPVSVNDDDDHMRKVSASSDWALSAKAMGEKDRNYYDNFSISIVSVEEGTNESKNGRC